MKQFPGYKPGPYFDETRHAAPGSYEAVFLLPYLRILETTKHQRPVMPTRAVFFTLIMGFIGTLQYFTQAWVMTAGGPADPTLFYLLHLFNNAFTYFRMGYASAMAYVLFVVIVLCTAVLFRGSRRFVHYQ